MSPIFAPHQAVAPGTMTDHIGAAACKCLSRLPPSLANVEIGQQKTAMKGVAS